MRPSNFYERLDQELCSQRKGRESAEKIPLGETILALREKAGLSGAELCRRGGGLDPRTLNAIEKGRIRNPSLESLRAIARGLGCLVKDIFAEAELQEDRHYWPVSQKGIYQFEFHDLGLRVISATPPGAPLFCGKLIFAPKSSFSGRLLPTIHLLFVEVILGKVELVIESRKTVLQEGESVYFNGRFDHTLSNPLNRESAVRIAAAMPFGGVRS